MQSLIIYNGSVLDRQDYIITNYPPNIYHTLNIKAEKSSITIKQIKSLFALTSTIPQKMRLIWIEEANLMTIPAQNALLKILEEPPIKTSFVLTLSNKDSLLPTILSRCTAKRIQTTSPTILNQDSLSLIKQAISQNEGERILTSRELGLKRHEALEWAESAINSLHTTLNQSSNHKQLQVVKKITKSTLKLHAHLTSNCNVKLALESYFLSLPKTR